MVIFVNMNELLSNNNAIFTLVLIGGFVIGLVIVYFTSEQSKMYNKTDRNKIEKIDNELSSNIFKN